MITRGSTKNARPSWQRWDIPCPQMPDDILLNKSQIIHRCLARVKEQYAN